MQSYVLENESVVGESDVVVGASGERLMELCRVEFTCADHFLINRTYVPLRGLQTPTPSTCFLGASARCKEFDVRY